MANKKVEFEIKVIGDALERLKQITGQTEDLGNTAGKTKSKLASLGQFAVGFNQAMEIARKLHDKLKAAIQECSEAYRAQLEVEAKLERVMRNTMRARVEEIQSIKDFTSAQQKLGVIGDEVQLAGAQELGTYLSKAESLRKLLPVMNNMLAQQYGYNASQEQAVQIASMMGKVMDGQVGALSRYGYKFDEAQEKLLKYGTEEQRVATLADVIGQSVGGMNRALARTDLGKIKQFSNRLGDIKERVGELYNKVLAKIVPVGNAVLGVVEDLLGCGNDSVRQIAREKVELNGLVEALINAGDNEELRKSIIEQLNANYPDFLENLDQEKITTEQLRDALAQTNAEYDRRMKKAALERRLNKLDEAAGEDLDDITKYQVSIGARRMMEEAQAKVRSLLPEGYSLAYNNRIGHTLPGVGFEYVSQDWIDKQANGELAAAMAQIHEARGLLAYNPFSSDEKKMAEAQKKYEEHKAQRDAIVSIIDSEFDDNQNGGGGGNKPKTNPDNQITDTVTTGATAAVTGGTRNTTVNINLGKMVENIVFNGTLGENAQELENKIQEILTRTLMMAAATA